MGIELGHFALVLASAIALGTAGLGLAFWRNAPWVTSFARQAAILQFILIGIAFAALIQAFVVSDFSLALAFENSHSQQPLIYRITSTWGNHEGSILLWVLILALFGAAIAAFGRNLPGDLLTLVLSIQSLMVAAFGGFSIFTSSPFIRLAPAPFEGRDLNPILQDIGLAIHPPLLYIGYVGFSVCFAFAAAALISGRIDAAWARWVRPWTLTSWLFLTLGIAMGSYWAYYELGWGGWWFWDPVENASFMPWLAATALLHSALVMEKRSALKIWTVFLAIMTFSLSLLGTFLVRSGVLTSVHSFASDPTRGIVILALLAAFIGGAFALFAWRAPSLKVGGLFAPVSREGALVLNNLFLATATAAVLVGTLYPLVLDALTGTRISVGAPFFNLTFSILMTPLLIVLPFGPFMAWKRGDLIAVSRRLAGAVVTALGLAVLVFMLSGAETSLAPLGFFLGFWVAVGALADLVDRAMIGRVSAGESWRRLIGLPRSAWSTTIAHFGLGMSVLGIVSASTFSTENITTLMEGQTATLSGYSVTLSDEQVVAGPNYDADRIILTVTAPGGATRDVSSEKRIYRASRMPTTEAGILTYGFSQLYIAIGDPVDGGGHVVRIWYKPFVTLIWFGAVIMAAAGALSLTDRRLRIGAPARRKPVREPAE
jgi:cytochrome c-type biogenesis protein CcmF